MYSRVSISVSRILALACVVLMPLALGSQEPAKSTPKASYGDSPSRFDLFAGYSLLYPKGKVTTLLPDRTGNYVTSNYTAAGAGAIASGAYFFNKYAGVQFEAAEHDMTVNAPNVNDGFITAAGGLIFRFPKDEITPFVHALVGMDRVGGPNHNAFKWGPGLTAGLGMDYNTPWLNHHLAIRVIQADFEYMHANFGPASQVLGGRANINAARVSAGIVYHIGSIAPPVPITIACSANPTSIFPGDPVTLTATASNLDPKLNAIYSWSGTGVTGNGTTATVATGALAPGSYTVKCGIKEGKPGKEGLKPWQTADASASFTVKAFEPPTISCSASPTNIKPGETSKVTATGVSPQNRPLTYSYSAAAGTISGTGTTATFSSTGAPTGTTGITCNVTDDKGQSAAGSTSVTITAPYVAPIPHTQTLCSIAFENDKKRPARVDNEAKACLDEVALSLQRQSDAKAVVVGDSTAVEKTPKKVVKKHGKALPVEDLAAERAVNTKDYLVTEKGIDASRISVATGTADMQKVEDYLVPSGATFSNDVAGTTPVDETVVKPQVRKPLPERHPVKKHASKPAKSVKPPAN